MVSFGGLNAYTNLVSSGMSPGFDHNDPKLPYRCISFCSLSARLDDNSAGSV